MDEHKPPDHPLLQKAKADLTRVIERVVAVTGCPTRWRGIVVVEDVAFPFSGQKQRSCAISLRQDVLSIPEWRWTTMIHESVHSVSAGFTVGRLDETQRRWEEAIAEQLQRLLRDELLASLGERFDEAVIRDLDVRHRYNAYIRMLEVYREAAGRPLRDFYLELLRSDPIQRAELLVLALRSPADRREEER